MIGYVIYPLAEGGCGVSEGLLFDQSPVMTLAYREFLRGKVLVL